MLLKSFVKEDEIIPTPNQFANVPAPMYFRPNIISDMNHTQLAANSAGAKSTPTVSPMAMTMALLGSLPISESLKSDIPIASSTIPASMTANRRHVTLPRSFFMISEISFPPRNMHALL